MNSKHSQYGFAPAVAAVALVIFVVVVTVALTAIIQEKQDTNRTPTDTSQSSDKQVPPLSPAEQMESAFLAYYVSHKTYPQPNSSGWNAFVAEIRKNRQQNGVETPDPFTDPDTGKTYKYTGFTPQAGQIQYKYPATCADDGQQIANPQHKNQYAFRLKHGDKIACYSNL